MFPQNALMGGPPNQGSAPGYMHTMGWPTTQFPLNPGIGGPAHGQMLPGPGQFPEMPQFPQAGYRMNRPALMQGITDFRNALMAWHGGPGAQPTFNAMSYWGPPAATPATPPAPTASPMPVPPTPAPVPNNQLPPGGSYQFPTYPGG